MALSRVKVWQANDILTASDLNAEFNNIVDNITASVSPLSADLDFAGYRILDLSAGSESAPGLHFLDDANTGLRHSAADTIEIVTAGADRWRVNSSGHLLAVDDNTYDIGATGATRPRDLFLARNARIGGTATIDGTAYIGDTANADVTLGLTINQGANDDQWLAGKSSDVAHGATTLAETDTMLAVLKSTAAGGGALLRALSDSGHTASNPTLLWQVASGIAADTTKSTSGRALAEVYATLISGTGWGDVTANGNVWGVRTRISSADTTVALLDEDGDLWLNGSLQLGTASTYINWGATAGSGGYGIRDNSGVVEAKISGGGWYPIRSALFGSTVLADTSTTYHSMGFVHSNATESYVNIGAPTSGIIRNLYVRISAAPGGGQSVSVTLRKAGADTDLLVTITDPATSGSNTSDNVAIAAGDLVDWKIITSYAAGGVTMQIGYTMGPC